MAGLRGNTVVFWPYVYTDLFNRSYSFVKKYINVRQYPRYSKTHRVQASEREVDSQSTVILSNFYGNPSSLLSSSSSSPAPNPTS